MNKLRILLTLVVSSIVNLEATTTLQVKNAQDSLRKNIYVFVNGQDPVCIEPQTTDVIEVDAGDSISLSAENDPGKPLAIQILYNDDSMPPTRTNSFKVDELSQVNNKGVIEDGDGNKTIYITSNGISTFVNSPAEEAVVPAIID